MTSLPGYLARRFNEVTLQILSLAFVGLNVRQHWFLASWSIYVFAKCSAYCIEVTLSSVRPAVWK
jgi:hypothetical protein